MRRGGNWDIITGMEEKNTLDNGLGDELEQKTEEAENRLEAEACPNEGEAEEAEKNQPEAETEEERDIIDRAVEAAAEQEEQDDGFFGRYVWDEETGRLYELTEEEPREKGKRLPLLLLLLPVIALAIGAARGVSLLPAGCYGGTSILSEAEMPPEERTDTPESQQAASEAAAGEEYIPAAIIIDGKTRAVLASTEAAEQLIEDVRSHFDEAVLEEGERTSELYGTVEVQPVPDAGAEDIQSYDEVYASFTSSRSPLKIMTTVTSRETKELPFDTEAEKDSTLVEGTYITLTLGRAGSKTTIKRTVYINGEKSSSRSKTETATIEPVDTVILKGTDKVSDGEPGRHEGEKGKEADSLSFASPIDADISSNFGQRDGVLHLGLDYKAEEGTAVTASEAGAVVCALERGGYGNMLEIDHGNGFVTRYAHLSEISVSVGDRVTKGQQVALSGSSGSCEEPCLHFELRIDGIAYNPRYYIEK